MTPTHRIAVSLLAGAGVAYLWKAHRVLGFVAGTVLASQVMARFVPPQAGV